MASTQIKFNARHGISVGSTPFSVLDNAGNATFNTITAGLWNGTIISGTYGGTGVNNGTKTITLGGNLVTSGAFNTTLTVGAATNVTLPTSGTLATTANLSQFASTTSAQLKGVISDETGSDGSSLVFATSPTLNTITVNGTNSASAVTLTGGTVTVSKPPIDITQTWNDAGVAFSGIKCVITNTASASNSKVIDFTIGNNKFGVDCTGAITQILSNPNLARDIVGYTGSRHVREYQDLNDWNTTQGIGGVTTNTENIEWGFTWNAKWDTTQVKYVKDRNNAGDHAVMFRIDKKFRNQWWFSDGTTPGEISWVKKVDFDCPNNLFWTSMPITSGGFTTTSSSSLGTTSTGNLTVNGDFIVNGTSTTINTSELNVDDINITLGSVTTPTDTTANGGGLTLLGATNKTITWNQGTTDWDFSENLNVATGKTFKVNNNVVLSQTALGSTVLSSSLTSVGTLTSGTWSATAIASNKGGTGFSSYAIGDILYADGAASLAKLAGVAVNNVLISGGIGVAPSWGKVSNSHLTNSTISGVALGSNLNALTLAVSGAGLSGSASYDGSGVATFTVASNATSANTASSIVARDASGNFTAGTITATLSGNASTVTTNANLSGHVTSVGNTTSLGSFTVAQLNTALSDADVATGGGTATNSNTGDNAANTSITPTSLGLVIGTNVQAYDADLTTWAGVTPGTGVATFLATPTLANFNTALSDADVATGGGTATGTNTGDNATNTQYSGLDAAKVPRTSVTGSAVIPAGTSAERDGSPSAGYFRYNSTLTSFEGHNGTSWGSVGGGATGGGTDHVFHENGQTVNDDYTITSGNNAGTFGPITIATGKVVTIPTGSVWSIV